MVEYLYKIGKKIYLLVNDIKQYFAKKEVDIMINIKGVEYIKAFSEMQLGSIVKDGIFGITDGETITWMITSDSFHMDEFKMGKRVDDKCKILNAIYEKKVIYESIPKSVYGQKIKVTSIPIADDDENIVGVFFVVLPNLHSVEKAFKDFSPIIADMFPNGAFLSIFDWNQLVYKQTSENFDIVGFDVGADITSDPVATEALKTGKTQHVDVDNAAFGKPIRVQVSPLFDEDTNEVVGAFNLSRPKEVELKLKNISTNIEESLAVISSTIEELAVSSSEIHDNQEELNNNIKAVTDLSEKINEVSSFIESIAEKTKMLGLNAAIEAARAGEYGRGFGVVADEIRKLSEQSKDTVSKIKELIEQIIVEVEASNIKSKNSVSSSQEQEAATQQVTSSIEELAKTSEELVKVASQM